MRIVLALGLTLAGCSFSRGSHATGDGPLSAIDGPLSAIDGPPSDAGNDGTPPADAQACFGPTGWVTCLTTLPTQPKVLPTTIDTSAASTDCDPTPPSWTSAGQPDACFVIATSITMPSNVGVSGARPLVLLATGAISIQSTLDAASHVLGKTGPGSPASVCAAFGTTPQQNSSTGGGGAGGSYMTAGGDGGTGNSTAAARGTAAAADASAPSKLRAGCDGQIGAPGMGAAGAKGNGGGAVYLVAGTTLTITGTINASGAGARGAGQKAGGSGAGSGGTIVLAANTITATGAKLLANGGGGSSGGSGSNGVDGGDPFPTTPLVQALAGAGSGGSGGLGDAAGLGAGTGGNAGNNKGGGGGGGGMGYIRSSRALTGATTSPAEAIVP